ncbi:MAG TPA: AI-2E family transporter [Acetobacteraceae bacterium]|nr:AI-2E family transporter [Acetobacteraceae bacterium]
MADVEPTGGEAGAERDMLVARRVMSDAEFSINDVALVILTFLAVLYTLYFAAEIVMPLVMAVVLALLLDPAVEFLNDRIHLPRMLAAGLLILVFFSLIVGVLYAISGPAAEWVAKAPQSFHIVQEKLGFLRRPIEMVQTVGTEAERAMHPGPQTPFAPQVNVSQGPSLGLSVLLGTRQFLGQMFTFVVMLFFLLAEGDTLLRRFVEILPGLREKKRAVQIATEIERNISMYLATITAMNLLVGVANGISVWLLGLPDPLLWGTVAFFLNYIPIIGPMTGIAAFFVVGLFSYTNILWAFAPAGIYLVVHILEGETITPFLLARRFTLNPVIVIGMLMFWDWLWGIPGAFLAVPLLAATKIVCDQIEMLTPIGHLLGNEASLRPRGEAEG